MTQHYSQLVLLRDEVLVVGEIHLGDREDAKQQQHVCYLLRPPQQLSLPAIKEKEEGALDTAMQLCGLASIFCSLPPLPPPLFRFQGLKPYIVLRFFLRGKIANILGSESPTY